MNKNDPNINKLIFSTYLIQKKIAKGSFGTVYSGIITSTNHKIAIKLEKRLEDYPGILEAEACRLYLLQGEGIPKIICYGNNSTDNILVQELLGSSLERLFNYLNKKFSLKTVCSIGMQLIKRIKHVHEKYHIHRDLKPDNFMTGYYKIDNKIYLIDFGLSKKYYSVSKKCHIKFKSGNRLIGTARYCSRNAHKGYELSRRDDIESIGYCLIYFAKGNLPWQGLKVKNVEEQFKKISEKKMQTSFEELTKNLPDEFLQYFKYCDNLYFEDEPNYEYLISLFKNVLDKFFQGENYYEYDWNKKIKNFSKSIKGESSNSQDVSLIVNKNNLSNNISAIDDKINKINEDKRNKKNQEKKKNEITNDDSISNENEEDIIDNDNNDDDISMDNEEKDNKNYNILRKLKNFRFLPPKKIEDFFPKETSGAFEMISDKNNEETNKDNNINNNEELKIESVTEKESKEVNKEKSKDNNIINNININININNVDKNKNFNLDNNKVNNNINIKEKDENREYELNEHGIIGNNSRKIYKKLGGNIDKQNYKDSNVKCACMII